MLPSLWLPSNSLLSSSATVQNNVSNINNQQDSSSLQSPLYHHHHDGEDSILCDGCRITKSIAVQVSTFTQRIMSSELQKINPPISTIDNYHNSLAMSMYTFPYPSLQHQNEMNTTIQLFSFIHGGNSLNAIESTAENNRTGIMNNSLSNTSPSKQDPGISSNVTSNTNSNDTSAHMRQNFNISTCIPVVSSDISSITPTILSSSMKSRIVTESIPYLNMKILVQNIGIPKEDGNAKIYNEVAIGIHGIRLIRRDGRIVFGHIANNSSTSRRNSQEIINDNVHNSTSSSLSSVVPSNLFSDTNNCIVAVDGNEIIPPVDTIILPYLSYAILKVCFPVLPDIDETENINQRINKDQHYLYGSHISTVHNDENLESIPVFEPEGLESCAIIEIPLWEAPSRIENNNNKYNPQLLGMLRIPFLEEGKLWSRYRQVAGGLMIRIERDQDL